MNCRRQIINVPHIQSQNTANTVIKLPLITAIICQDQIFICANFNKKVAFKSESRQKNTAEKEPLFHIY